MTPGALGLLRDWKASDYNLCWRKFFCAMIGGSSKLMEPPTVYLENCSASKLLNLLLRVNPQGIETDAHLLA